MTDTITYNGITMARAERDAYQFAYRRDDGALVEVGFSDLDRDIPQKVWAINGRPQGYCWLDSGAVERRVLAALRAQGDRRPAREIMQALAYGELEDECIAAEQALSDDLASIRAALEVA